MFIKRSNAQPRRLRWN